MLIAKSDAVILIVTASLLTVGIYRWQSNVFRAHENRSVSSSTSAMQSNGGQRSDAASSLSAKSDQATNSAAGAGIDAPAETNFGNAGQPRRQDANLVSQDAANQTGADNTSGQLLYGTYEVESGDTLSRIAINFGTTIDTLRTINDISGSLIFIGQEIRYPLPAN